MFLVENETHNHYVWIKNFDKLLFGEDGSNRSIYCCPNCLNERFATKEKLERHTKLCMNFEKN